MKLIYVVIIFLLFFNIFNFMFSWTSMFNYMYEPSTGDAYSDINISEDELPPSESVFRDVTGGIDYGNVFSIFFGNFDSWADILTIAGLIGAAAALAWATKSLAPFVLVFLGNLIKNTYENSLGVFEQFPVNDYIWLIFGIGMAFLLVITAAEYMTHGDV